MSNGWERLKDTAYGLTILAYFQETHTGTRGKGGVGMKPIARMLLSDLWEEIPYPPQNPIKDVSSFKGLLEGTRR